MATRGGAQTLVPAWSLSAGAEGVGGSDGGSTLARDTQTEVPMVPVGHWAGGGPGVQGPAPAGSQHLLPQENLEERPPGRVKAGDSLEEMPRGPLKVEMGPAPPCTTTTLGRDFLIYPPYFPVVSHLIFPWGGLLQAGINPLPAAGRACLNFPTRVCGFWLAGLCWFSSF